MHVFTLNTEKEWKHENFKMGRGNPELLTPMDCNLQIIVGELFTI